MNGTEKSPQLYARLAGFLYLFILAVFDLSDNFLVSPAIVTGNVALTAHNILASETLYRLGLTGQFVASWLTLPLGWALYALLSPVDSKLALLALLFRTVETVLGSVCALTSFVALRVYTGTALGPGEAQAAAQLLSRTYNTCFTLTVIFFSVGSIIFFYLLLRSRFIPRLLSAFGFFASVLVTLLGFAALIVPPYATALAMGYIPIMIAETATGLWLLIAGVSLSHWTDLRRAGAA